MSLLQTAINGNNLIVWHKNNMDDKIALSLEPKPGNHCRVQVWDDECLAHYVSEHADKWFSIKLSIDCRLVYMPDNEKRKVDGRYAFDNEITSFSDGYPLLIVGQASLDDLNSRLAQDLPINRFRPNVVFTGGLPYDEDTMEHISINGIDLYGVKLCARCTVTTIDQSSAEKTKEPLKTLAGYRMKDNKIFFGQNVLIKQTGLIRKGDAIAIVSSKPPVLFS